MITYFIQSGDFVKIGKTRNLKARLQTISSMSSTPIKLLKVSNMPESEAHKIAGSIASRPNGEWFSATQSLLRWIESVETVEVPAPKGNSGLFTLRLPDELLSQIDKDSTMQECGRSYIIRRILAAHYAKEMEVSK